MESPTAPGGCRPAEGRGTARPHLPPGTGRKVQPLSSVPYAPAPPAGPKLLEPMYNDVRAINELVQKESAFLDAIMHEVKKVIVGQEIMIERMLIGLLTGGHVLVEGVPGLAKTLSVKTLCDTLSAKFSRIQFTPDMLPADVPRGR